MPVDEFTAQFGGDHGLCSDVPHPVFQIQEHPHTGRWFGDVGGAAVQQGSALAVPDLRLGPAERARLGHEVERWERLERVDHSLLGHGARGLRLCPAQDVLYAVGILANQDQAVHGHLTVGRVLGDSRAQNLGPGGDCSGVRHLEQVAARHQVSGRRPATRPAAGQYRPHFLRLADQDGRRLFVRVALLAPVFQVSHFDDALGRMLHAPSDSGTAPHAGVEVDAGHLMAGPQLLDPGGLPCMGGAGRRLCVPASAHSGEGLGLRSVRGSVLGVWVHKARLATRAVVPGAPDCRRRAAPALVS